jgi:glycosyltransferase involved in cell wall biosynthesis
MNRAHRHTFGASSEGARVGVNGFPGSASRKPADALRGRDIITFSNDWSGDPLSKTHLMRLLARENRVLWIDSIGLRTPSASSADFKRAFSKIKAAAAPIREVEPNLFVFSPLSIPAYGQPLLREFNRLLLLFQVKRAMRRLRFKNVINYVFLPSAGLVTGKLNESLVLYHCVDEYSAFTGIPSQALLDIEEKLLRRADLVICSAEKLVESKSKVNPRTYLVRHGVDFTHFRKALDAETVVPEDISKLPRPVIGFFGLVADWVDVELMEAVAKHFSRGSLVILGKTTTDVSRLTALANVHFLGRKRYEDLPAYCKGFDVALNPFVVNELTLNANPLKVREYLAAGLPVVSTPIPEVEVLGLCRIGRDRESFIREIETALANPGPSVEMSEAIRSESWEARLDEVRHYLVANGLSTTP